MQRSVISLAVVVASLCFTGSVHARSVTGLDRNPESCYDCHQGHIIEYHNDTVLSEPAPLDADCALCHNPATTPEAEITCDACHRSHSFDKLKFDRAVGTWSMTGPMSAARFLNTASLLNDGRFLVTGGVTPPFFGATNTAEVLDPQTRLWVDTTAAMSTTRLSHQQTTLADGKVLITGGRSQISPFIPGAAVLSSAELYDPATDSFLPAGTLVGKRRSHRDILLDDGRVLLTGGTDAITGDQTSLSLNTAEVYDPASGSFMAVGDMNVARQSHHLVKLLDGRVLVVGGGEGPGLSNPSTSLEIFDPATNTFVPAGSMSSARMTTVATLLDDGRVLLAYSWDGGDVTNASEIYDPDTQSVTPVDGLPIHGKVDLLGVRLYDGTVVTPTGGNELIQVLPDTSVYRPNRNDFILAGSVQFPRTTGYSTGALIPDGRIVAAGGIGLSSAGAPIFFPVGEIYTPSDLAQAKGLKKVIGDLPRSAFSKPEKKGKLKDRVSDVIDILRDEGKEKQAKQRLVNQVISRMDGCAGGNPHNDWITACDDQAIPYAAATRLVTTLDELLGVLQPPMLTAMATPSSGPYPLTVNFQADASDPDGTVISYYWDFGNGQNSIAPSPTANYACPGDYNALASVIDNDGLIVQDQITITTTYPAGITASYECDILPAHTAFCGKVCHFPDSPREIGAGVDLTSYAGIIAGRELEDGTFVPIVFPGDAENSPIVQITDSPRNHASDVGGERLNDLVKARQRAWINEGAQEN